MDNIVVDASGNLVSGVFFEFAALSEDQPLVGWEAGLDAVLYKRNPTDDELFVWKNEAYLWLDITFGRKELKCRCPIDDAHVTEIYWLDLAVELLHGTHLAPFVLVNTEGSKALLVSAAFAEQLKLSGLSGFALDNVKVKVKPRVNEKVPRLFYLSFQGKKCRRPLLVRGAPNACSWCGYTPILCQRCAFANHHCPSCGKECMASRGRHKGPGDRRLIVCPYEEWSTPILEGSRWDGSDFIFGGTSFSPGDFITKRALLWLESVHAAPFAVRPALVNIEGLDEEQLARIEAAKKAPAMPAASSGTSAELLSVASFASVAASGGANEWEAVAETDFEVDPFENGPEIMPADVRILDDGRAELSVKAYDIDGHEVVLYEWDLKGRTNFESADATGPVVYLSPGPDAWPYTAVLRVTDAAGRMDESLYGFAADGSGLGSN
ncbi:MAG: hypothetical protein KY476_22270 [Planctomycetes bacterium]|nr:hypothetical protein [Planctomycetota bacterium]